MSGETKETFKLYKLPAKILLSLLKPRHLCPCVISVQSDSLGENETLLCSQVTCPQSGTLLNTTSFRFLLLVTDLQVERGPENNLDVVTCVCFCST